MSDHRPLAPTDIRVGATYRGKKVIGLKEDGTAYNDRTVISLMVDGGVWLVEFTSDTLRSPSNFLERNLFIQWASHEVKGSD